MSRLESLYKKKPTKNNPISKQESKNSIIEKNYSIKIELTSGNILDITLVNTKKDTTNNSIDKLLNSLIDAKKSSSFQMESNFLQEHVSVLVNGKKIESKRIISRNNSMSVLLDESSKYGIEVIADK